MVTEGFFATLRWSCTPSIPGITCAFLESNECSESALVVRARHGRSRPRFSRRLWLASKAVRFRNCGQVSGKVGVPCYGAPKFGHHDLTKAHAFGFRFPARAAWS